MRRTFIVRVSLAAMGLLALAPPDLAAQTANAPGALTMEQLEKMAIGHPAFSEASLRAEAARSRIGQAGAFPNPEIGYVGEEIPLQGDTPGGRHGVFVEQVIPLGGKRGLSRGVAEQETRRLDALVGVQRQALLTHVRQLAYSAAAAARRVELRDRLSQLADETVVVTRQLYNIGSADQPDVLQAETQADLARLAAEEARSDQLRIWRMLAAAVDEPGLPLQALAIDLDGPLPAIDLDVERERLIRDSPEMKVLSALIEREEAALKRAQREPAPDLFLRGAPLYNREPRETASRPAGWETSIEVGVRVPLFDRNRGAIDGAATDAAVARHASERAKLDLESRLADAFADYAGARRRAEVLKGEALPRAERAYEMYRARYKEMAAPYPRVLTAQQTLIELSVAYLDAVEVAWRSAALIQGTLVAPRAVMER